MKKHERIDMVDTTFYIATDIYCKRHGIIFCFPKDVIGGLKQVAPRQGSLGYQPLIRT